MGLAVLAAAGCGGGGKATLASVNGEPITKKQVDERLGFFQVVYRHQMNSQDVNQLRSQLVDMLIDETVLVQEAKKLKLVPEAKAVKDETVRLLDSLKMQNFNNSEEQMRRSLKHAGLSEKALEAIVARQLTIDALFRKKTDGLKVSDDEVRAYYEQNKEKMVRPETVKLLQLRTKSREDAEKAEAELKKGKDFIEVSRTYSADPMVTSHRGMTGSQGQPLGITPVVVERGQLPPELEKAAFSLSAGQFSSVVESQGSYYILKVEEKREAGAPAFEEVRENLRAGLLDEKKGRVFEQYVNDLRKAAKVEINKAASGGSAPAGKPAAGQAGEAERSGASEPRR